MSACLLCVCGVVVGWWLRGERACLMKAATVRAVVSAGAARRALRRALLAENKMRARPVHKKKKGRTTHLRKRARAVVLDLVVAEVELSKLGVVVRAQAARDADRAVVAEPVAAQVELCVGAWWGVGRGGWCG